MSPNAPDFSGGQTSSQFQGGIQPQFPRYGMRQAGKTCLPGAVAAQTGDYPPPSIPECKSGSGTRKNDMRLDFGGDLAGAVLSR